VTLQGGPALADKAGAAQFLINSVGAKLTGTIPAGQKITVVGEAYSSNGNNYNGTTLGLGGGTPTTIAITLHARPRHPWLSVTSPDALIGRRRIIRHSEPPTATDRRGLCTNHLQRRAASRALSQGLRVVFGAIGVPTRRDLARELRDPLVIAVTAGIAAELPASAASL